MLHADARRAVAAHRMADQAAARAVGNRAVMRVDVRDDVVRDDVALEVAGRRPSSSTSSRCAAVFESGSTTIISFAPWAKAPSMVCGTWISLRPLLGADRVTVQRVDDG